MLDQKIIKWNFKKGRLKEMELLTIMINIAKFFENKLQLSLSKGYKIKVGKNSYMLFKKEEDYVILIYLERVFYDLFKNLLFNDDDEDKEIRVFFRLSLIKKYVKKLPNIEIKIFYDKNKCKNPTRIKFPNLSYLDYYNYEEIVGIIQEKIEDFYNKDIDYMYSGLEHKINKKINIKYYKW